LSGGDLYIVGTRTFSAEVLDFVRAAGLRVAGLLEPFDRSRVGSEIHGLPVGWLESVADGGSAIVGTGDAARREIVGRVEAAGLELLTLVHPHASVAASASVGRGAVVGPGAVVGACAAIGEHVVCGRGALVGHHTEVGEFATLAPGVNVAGNVHVGRDAFLGMGSVVRDHVSIGDSAVVGMGAVVLGDVAAGTQVRGVPATPVTR
jgi:sugar O-acyltransferase (sialic acid O-acetyltransferase NeuD family)